MTAAGSRGPRSRGRTAAALLAASLAPAAAGAATLEVALEPETVTVGDRLEARLILSTGPGELAGEPRFPEWGERWGAVEVVEVGAVERHGDEHRQRLVLVAFRTGDLELPPRPVAVPGPDRTEELRTPADLALRVESVLPAGEETEALEPEPPAPPRALPVGAPFWWTLGALSLLAAGALALAARRHRGGAAAAAGPRRSPAEELTRALAEVREVPAPEEGHARLSLALRRYLGRSLGFPAVESTTSEIRRELRARRVPAAVEGRTDEILRACDRVKFAREPVARAALAARIEAAREVAGELEAHRAPPPVEGSVGSRREAA